MILVPNEMNELVLMRLVTGWIFCIDYWKLNAWTAKDHFPMPFMDQILDRLARKGWHCSLMGIQVTTKSLLHWQINRKPPLLVLSGSRGFLLCCVMHRLLFNDV